MNNINSLTVYGIPNCDTVKKAMNYLKSKNINFQFHNYKTEGIKAELLKEWFALIGSEAIINKKSSTWKALPDAQKALANNQASLITLLQANTSIIKRPIIIQEGVLPLVGFNEAEYEQKLV